MAKTPTASLANGSTTAEVQLRALPENLQDACKICIDSAIRSTVAFDCVDTHRLVVPNIFGTAHSYADPTNPLDIWRNVDAKGHY